MLAHNTFCDMPDLLTACVQQGYKVATFPIREYWLDIGRHEDLERAHLDYKKVF
jgi:NDP-sugar pyrophosphorylase family protein